MLLGAIDLAARLDRLPPEARAGLIGAAVAVVAWFAPALVGGGDSITQQTLAGGVSLALVPLAFLLRAVLGSVSYAAGTPGGLFAPMLMLGFSILRSQHETVFGISSLAFGMILVAAGVVVYGLSHALKPQGWAATAEKPQVVA